MAISVIDVPSAPFSLTYETTTLRSPSTVNRNNVLNRGKVGKALGPTYAGAHNEKLSYPGISFELSGNGGREDLVKSIMITSRSEETKPLNPLSGCRINVRRESIFAGCNCTDASLVEG